MKRIFFELAYDGTDYGGWQIQPDNISIQEVIEEKLADLYVNQPIRIHSSGRTDAGVHAMGQTITFDTPDRPRIPPENLKMALNNSLPDSIQIFNADFAPEPEFHARYSAIGKAYTYIINTGLKTPFNSRYSWNLPECKEIQDMKKASEFLQGTHDFSSFTTSRKDIDNAVRTIFRIDIEEKGEMLFMTFIGSGFLYKMVRSIVGSLIMVGKGEMEVNDVNKILDAKDRSKAPKSAPPNGLFLMKVFYNQDSLEKFNLRSELEFF